MTLSRETEILTELSGTQGDVALEFAELSNAVQEIAYKKISMSKTESELVSHLDRCDELRLMTNTPDGVCVEEVKTIVKFYNLLGSKSS